MSQARMENLYRIARVLGLAALMSTVIAGLGCGGATRSSANLAPTSTIQVRLGSEPSDRVVSLSLTLGSLQATNSGGQSVDLLTHPIAVELTRSAIVADPISIRDIYQDTYSALVFPDMTGQIVFYDVDGQLVSQPLSVPAQTVPYNFVLGTDPTVLSISLNLAQTFTITDAATASRFPRGMGQGEAGGTSSVTVNPLAVTGQNALPNPAVGQPESGSISFLVGSVTGVNTTSQTISIQPVSGDAMQVSYDIAGRTTFVDCDPSTLTGMMVEAEGTTQANGSILASEVELIDNSQSGSELYGLLSGYAPEGWYYNLIVEGGDGVNVTSGLIGKNVSVDWLAASYSVNRGSLDLSGSPDLVFDEIHAFPGQFVEIEWDTLVVPDPESTNAGLMQPGMFELEQQTISGQVVGYTYDPISKTGSFTLTVASNASIRTMNPGLTSITVRQIPQTYLRNLASISNGAQVKVRGLLFVDPSYSNVGYQPSPSSPVAFIRGASRVSQ
jgi:hypothetical protein